MNTSLDSINISPVSPSEINLSGISNLFIDERDYVFEYYDDIDDTPVTTPNVPNVDLTAPKVIVPDDDTNVPIDDVNTNVDTLNESISNDSDPSEPNDDIISTAENVYYNDILSEYYENCPLCDKICNDMRTLNDHMMSEHGNNNNEVQIAYEEITLDSNNDENPETITLDNANEPIDIDVDRNGDTQPLNDRIEFNKDVDRNGDIQQVTAEINNNESRNDNNKDEFFNDVNRNGDLMDHVHDGVNDVIDDLPIEIDDLPITEDFDNLSVNTDDNIPDCHSLKGHLLDLKKYPYSNKKNEFPSSESAISKETIEEFGPFDPDPDKSETDTPPRFNKCQRCPFLI